MLGLYVATLLFSLLIGEGIDMRSAVLVLRAGNAEPAVVRRKRGIAPVFWMGRWWTILSAGWLHGGAAPLLQHDDGPPARTATADIYGAARMVIIYTIGGAVGFLCSSIAGYLMPPCRSSAGRSPLARPRRSSDCSAG